MENGILISVPMLLVLLSIFGCEDQAEASDNGDIQPVSENEGIFEQQQVIEAPASGINAEPVVENAANEIEIKPAKEGQQAQQTIKHDINLAAHFTFNENADDIANGLKGVVKGGAEFRNGKLGNAMYFDGIDDYVELPDEALNSVGRLKQGTIAFWLNFDSILNKQAVMPIFYTGIKDKPDNEDNMFIIEIGHAAGTEDFSQQGFPPGTPDPENKRIYATWIKDGQDPFLCSDSEVNIDEGQWQHFALVSGANGNTLYLNGKEVRNRDYNFGHSTDKAFLNDIPVKEIMTIGYGRSHTWISPDFVYFKGLLDDFRIYNRTLETDEIEELFAMGG
jgi:hypothetical protein